MREQSTLGDGGDVAADQDGDAPDAIEGCVVITSSGRVCGNGLTSNAADAEARLCGTHVKGRDPTRADEIDGRPDPDLRDQLVDAGLSGATAYRLATVTDDPMDLWHLVTGLEDVDVGAETIEGDRLAYHSEEIAAVAGIDEDAHPLAHRNCAAIIEDGAIKDGPYRCRTQRHGTHSLCGTHEKAKRHKLTTVYDEDAPEDLKVGDYHRVSFRGHGSFYAVEERDGDLLAMDYGDLSYVRLEGVGDAINEADRSDDHPALEMYSEDDVVRINTSEGAELCGRVCDEGGTGWRTPEGGAGDSLFVEEAVYDGTDGLVVIEAMREQGAEWEDATVEFDPDFPSNEQKIALGTLTGLSPAESTDVEMCAPTGPGPAPERVEPPSAEGWSLFASYPDDQEPEDLVIFNSIRDDPLVLTRSDDGVAVATGEWTDGYGGIQLHEFLDEYQRWEPALERARDYMADHQVTDQHPDATTYRCEECGHTVGVSGTAVRMSRCMECSGTMVGLPADEPEVPDSLPKYLREGLEKQGASTLRDVAEYAAALADFQEALAEADLEAQADQDVDETPDEWDEDEWEDALEDAMEKANLDGGKGTLTVKTIDGRGYYYLQWREGEKIKSQYVAPVSPAGDGDD